MELSPVIVELETLSKELSLDIVRTEDFAAKYDVLTATIEMLSNIKSEIDGQVKTQLQDEYMTTGEQTIATGKFNFTFVPGSFRESIDSKKLKADHPDLYTQYVKTSQVAPSIRITKKKDN